MIKGLETYGTQRGKYQIVVVENPRVTLSEDIQRQIATASVELAKNTFKRDTLTADEIIPTVLGEPNSGKILGMVLKDGELTSIAAGQLLNNRGTPISFDGDHCLHMSVGHSLPDSISNPSIVLTTMIAASLPQRPRYLSGFTQNPRLYEYARRLSGQKIIPTPDQPQPYLQAVYDKAIETFPRKWIENGVFRSKVTGGFSGEVNEAYSPRLNRWWQDVLRVRPENGDLLFFLADFK